MGNPDKKRAKGIQQKIFSTLIIFVVLAMMFGSMEISRAANQANSELYQNIVAGTLDISAQNSNISFANVNAGTAANSLMNFNNVKVTDYRGTGAGWSATTGSIENFQDVADANIQIVLSNSLKWTPGQITPLNGASATGVSAGTADQYLNATRNLMTATASNGKGAYQIDNTLLNFIVGAEDPAGNFSATMTLTVA
ncbi:MAG: WxL domain-containing protein [Patescibacteria group bacterium]|nr:WxL domain-containing protein [Patescibacteria group bacterium]